jgi:P4 family phage/plasmid primase-like protien
MALVARSSPEDGPQVREKPPAGDAILAACKVLFGDQDEGLVELRSIGVTRHSSSARHTETSLYCPDDMGFKRLAKDARDLTMRAEGIYCTLNPVMTRVGLESAKDRDIIQRRWFLVDCDPVRAASTSATDAEKALALVKVQAIRNHLRAEGWPDPVLADSGNGYHLLYRIDLPNDADTTALVRGALRALAARFDDDQVKVDTSVYNASRICKLYGTLARKGESTTERPHRPAALVEVPKKLQVTGPEWLSALAAAAPAEPAVATNGNGKAATNGKPRRKGLIARDLGEDPKEAYATQALQDELGKLRAASVGDRNNQLFRSAAALAQIVSAGALDQAGTINELAAVARSIGLDEHELQRTLQSAFKAGSSTPRDMSKVGKREREKEPTLVDPETGIEERLDDPHRLARAFLRAHYHHHDGPTLRFWNDEFHAWRDGRWRPCSEREINGAIASFCKSEFRERPEKAVGTRLVGNVALALRGMVTVPLHDVPEQPAWLDSGDAELPDPAECLPTRSEIVHLPTLLERGPTAPGAVMAKTPRFFSVNVLGYSFDPNPPRPDAWLGFLADLWPDDPEAIRALQQWFGYLVTSDTAQQKILLLIGPKRSGKGTITRTLRALVGESNVAAPTLSTLASQFGAQSLIGKTVAVCPESRLTGRSDSQAIVERLLSISGEDPQSVDRKHLTAWHGTLRTRFVLLGNELPRLGDYSGALPGRMIVLKMTRSFFGQEDLGLQDRILTELPGILVWAIAGWQDLRAGGRFLQPASGQEMLEEFESLTNPIGAFLAERCDLGGSELKVNCKDLYEAWKTWCEENGRDHPGDAAGFGKNLKAAVSTVRTEQIRMGSIRTRVFRCVQLKEEDHAAF